MSDNVIFQSTFLYSASGIAVLGKSGKIRLANLALQRLFGKTKEELQGASFIDFIHPRDKQSFLRGMRAVLAGHVNLFKKDLRYLRDKKELWCRISLSLIPNPGKSTWILTINVEDVTENYRLIDWLKMTGLEAEKAREEAEKATKTKSEFLANMSHEIRTPIHTIIGMTELMQETALDPEQQEYTEQIQFSADILLSLINEILDFEKIEAGKLKLEKIEVNLFEILENAMDLVALEGHRKGLEMILDVDVNVPPVVMGDPVRLRQILVNLVNNAIKFTHQGEIAVKVSIAEERDDSFVLLFEVRDTGIGIPEEKRKKLFKEFSQVDSSTTRKYGGTGLGLSISKQLASLMGGKIGVRSGDGRGSIFWFTAVFPVKDKELSVFTGDYFAGKRALVADDNSNSRDILITYLAGWGFDVIGVDSGEAALKELSRGVAAERPYDLCFIDLVMPKMDGWHLASEIKTNTKISDTKLALLSPAGQGTIEPKMKLLNWFAGYLDKPIKIQKLLDLCLVLTGEKQEKLSSDKTAAGQSGGARVFRAGRVLVAEDHEVNQQLFKTILQHQGQEVVLANNGAEAVKAVEKQEFDVIFMDVQMPEMNGYEASKKIRELGVQTPIVAVTASAIKGERDKCLASGMTDFLTKPFKKMDILPVLEKYVGEEAADLEEVTEVEMAEDGEAPQASPAVPRKKMGLIKKAAISRGADTAPAGEGEEPGERDLPEVFDWDEAMETFMNDESVVLTVLQAQIEKVSGQIPVMEESLASGQWESLREQAHSIKGGSWNLQARELGDSAALVEEAAKGPEPEAAAQGLEAVKKSFVRFKARAEAILREKAAGKKAE